MTSSPSQFIDDNCLNTARYKVLGSSPEVLPILGFLETELFLTSSTAEMLTIRVQRKLWVSFYKSWFHYFPVQLTPIKSSWQSLGDRGSTNSRQLLRGPAPD